MDAPPSRKLDALRVTLCAIDADKRSNKTRAKDNSDTHGIYIGECQANNSQYRQHPTFTHIKNCERASNVSASATHKPNQHTTVMATKSEQLLFFSRICKYSLGRLGCDVEEPTSPFSVEPGTDEHFPGGCRTNAVRHSHIFRKIGKQRMRGANHTKDRSTSTVFFIRILYTHIYIIWTYYAAVSFTSADDNDEGGIETRSPHSYRIYTVPHGHMGVGLWLNKKRVFFSFFFESVVVGSPHVLKVGMI